MRDILFEDFKTACFPENWFINSNNYCWEKQGLKCCGTMGISIPLPKHEYKQLHVDIEIETSDKTEIECFLDGVQGLNLMLHDSNYPRHTAARHQNVFGQSKTPVLKKSGRRKIRFEFDGINLKALVDEQEIIAVADPYRQPLTGTIDLGFYQDCVIHKIRISSDEKSAISPKAAASRVNSNFGLEVCVDFYDDLINAPFTGDMFHKLFDEFKSWGVHRVHWIQHGKMSEGWWDFPPLVSGENARKTYENVGEIFNAAVKSAHEHDISIFGLLKPFDMGLQVSHGETDPEAKRQGKIQRIGGPVGWITNFAAKHRELMMSRRPDAYGPSQNRIFTRIDLVKEDDLPCDLSANDIKLYVSDDNTAYYPYNGPMDRQDTIEDYPVYRHTPSGSRPTDKKRKSRIFRLYNLEIKNKYLALSVSGRQKSFANSLNNLIHVFGESGEENFLTYGLWPRQDIHQTSQSFQQKGFEFDRFPGPPTALFAGGLDAVCATFILDSNEGVIALARGKDADTLAALSPSFPETRQWWLSWMRDILEAGADGVELRLRNHHSHLAWVEYGFEAPVVDAFRQRYGVDILKTDDFDKAALRRLRGEAYTQFYREVKQLVAAYGKLLGLHLSTTLDTDPRQGASMNIHWDWRTWLQEGLADSITLKDTWPHSYLAQEIFSYTRPQGIPVIFCPYASYYLSQPIHTANASKDNCNIIEALIKNAQNSGCSGFQLYESASVIRADADGKIRMQHPALRDLFRKLFVK